jgi:UDP-3-O-[3-hydroxymyristoyl] glucosamine N-acyltransferase
MNETSGYALSELAGRFGLELRGADIHITGVGTLAQAGPGQLGFLANPRYRAALADSGAAAVVLREDDAAAAPMPVLVARDPYASFAKIAALFENRPAHAPGVHASAVVADGARVDPSAHIGPGCVVDSTATVGPGAVIGPGSVVGPDCEVGADCELVARVTLVARVRLGNRVRVHPGAVIGSAGFGLAMEDGRWLNVPQLGGVRIGDDCEIGANTTIDRGALGDTVLEEDVRLDNQIQIGHNVHIGAHTAMAGCSAVAGSARIGRYCLVGGGAGILGHLEICDRVTLTAMSLVSRSIHHPGEYSSGLPLQDNRSWRRNAARFKRLDEMARTLERVAKDPDRT